MSFIPKLEQLYYFINSCGEAIEEIWYSSTYDVKRKEFYNCFETKEEAERASNKIRALLKEQQEEKEQEELYTKLPEWCVCNAWCWRPIKGYFQITSIEEHNLDGTKVKFVSQTGTSGWFTPYSINKACLPARKEYNLQSILGKSITLSNGDTVTVTGYNQSEQCVHLSNQTKHSIENLLTCENVRLNFDLNRFKLKHLAGGEWVE